MTKRREEQRKEREKINFRVLKCKIGWKFRRHSNFLHVERALHLRLEAIKHFNENNAQTVNISFWASSSLGAHVEERADIVITCLGSAHA